MCVCVCIYAKMEVSLAHNFVIRMSAVSICMTINESDKFPHQKHSESIDYATGAALSLCREAEKYDNKKLTTLYSHFRLCALPLLTANSTPKFCGVHSYAPVMTIVRIHVHASGDAAVVAPQRFSLRSSIR